MLLRERFGGEVDCLFAAATALGFFAPVAVRELGYYEGALGRLRCVVEVDGAAAGGVEGSYELDFLSVWVGGVVRVVGVEVRGGALGGEGGRGLAGGGLGFGGAEGDGEGGGGTGGVCGGGHGAVLAARGGGVQELWGGAVEGVLYILRRRRGRRTIAKLKPRLGR